jgi:hypothetical protein
MSQKNIPKFIGWPQNRTERYTSILSELATEPDKWHSITEIQEKVLTKYPEIFKVDITWNKHKIKENFHEQFHAYLKDLNKLALVEIGTGRSKWNTMDIKTFKIK